MLLWQPLAWGIGSWWPRAFPARAFDCSAWQPGARRGHIESRYAFLVA